MKDEFKEDPVFSINDSDDEEIKFYVIEKFKKLNFREKKLRRNLMHITGEEMEEIRLCPSDCDGPNDRNSISKEGVVQNMIQEFESYLKTERNTENDIYLILKNYIPSFIICELVPIIHTV